MYNRCHAASCRYIPAGRDSRSKPHSSKAASVKKPPSREEGGLSSMLQKLLPKGLDFGDILLFLILLFLYVETKDEEFLIILILTAYWAIAS